MSATVAVVQAAPVGFDRERSIDKVADLAADAARRGAQLVLFPEAFIPAYPRGLDFGAVVGARSDKGRDDFRRYAESALEIPSKSADRLAACARDNKVYLVIGVVERDGGTLYCTALFFAPDGALLGKHRKLMPTASERLIWGFGDGSTLAAFDTPLGRVGAAICWENYMPLLRTALYGKGVEIWCAPTADGRETWLPTMRHVAIEGRCFVLSANQFARRSDYPADYASPFGDDPNTVVSNGGSCIVDPFGKLLAGPLWGEEGILIAQIDRAQIARGKFDLDVVGHYARPDVFQLVVDERPRPAVRTRDAGDDL